MDFEKHLEYNAYKDSLNEIFDKLDEVIYISNTIDYKKINILLSEIVQNFDYYNIYTIPSANVGKAVEMTVGGKRGRRKVKGGVGGTPVGVLVGTPVEGTPVTPLDKQQQPTQETLPYSDIDDQPTTITHIIEGDEYKNLVSYIQDTKTRIDDKGGKLKTKVDNFINNHLLTLDAKDNHMIRDDFLKQYSSIVFKLEDIIKNIQNIKHGIQDEGTADAKINVDLMTNQWYLFSWDNTRFFTTDWLYRWFKKPFAKDAHVIEADKLTKERYNAFQAKLYDLYVKLHKGFPQSEGKKYETNISELVFTKINIKLEETYNKLKAKAEAAKAEEANEEKERAYKEANEAEDATPKETNDTTVKVKSSTTQPPTTQSPSTTTTQSPQQSTTTTTTTTQSPQQSPQQSPSIATQQPPQSSEEDITTMALKKVEESKNARLKARADANNAKEKLMKIEEDAKEKMEALAKQKAELEEQARASVLAERDKASSTIKGLIGKAPQITNAKNSFGNLGNVGNQFGLLKPKIPTNLTQ